MKKKRFSKKLSLNKTTITNLSDLEMHGLHGRDGEDVACLTEPEPSCPDLSLDGGENCTQDGILCPKTKPSDCPDLVTRSVPPYCIC